MSSPYEVHLHPTVEVDRAALDPDNAQHLIAMSEFLQGDPYTSLAVPGPGLSKWSIWASNSLYLEYKIQGPRVEIVTIRVVNYGKGSTA